MVGENQVVESGLGAIQRAAGLGACTSGTLFHVAVVVQVRSRLTRRRVAVWSNTETAKGVSQCRFGVRLIAVGALLLLSSVAYGGACCMQRLGKARLQLLVALLHSLGSRLGRSQFLAREAGIVGCLFGLPL